MITATQTLADAQHAWTVHLDHCPVCKVGNDWCGDGRLLLSATAQTRYPTVPQPRDGAAR